MKKYHPPEMEIELFSPKDMFHFGSPNPGLGCDPESGPCEFETECDLVQECDMYYFNPPCPAEWGGGPDIFD